MAHIFLIGPGGVGKSSVGRELAPLLNRKLIDLDDEFCARVENIGAYLEAKGYTAYVRQNAMLFRDLLDENREPALFVLSSGFLETDVERKRIRDNRTLVKRYGVSVLVMPSPQFEESLGIVVNRQLERGLYTDRDFQVQIFTARFQPYLDLADIRVFSTLSPREIAHEITTLLQEQHPTLLSPTSKG